MPIPDDAKAQGAPPNWLAYICVSDVSAIADKAKGLGAKILHEPTDIPDAGCFAVLQDPQGAVFAVYASSSELDAEAPAQIGEFSWHELATDDHGAAFDFYSELFGWDKSEAMDMGPEAGIYQLYARNGNQLGGMFNRPKEMPVSAWLYYVTVDDVHTSVEKVRDLGGTVINGPMEVPGGEFIAQCIDPQGAMFALHSAAK
ncbi:MAG: VOC family protein [bacterium]|nr:VOC family protein [bacterium]